MSTKFSILDQRTAILANRTTAVTRMYIPARQKRRLQANHVIDHYMMGQSQDVNPSLETSLANNYVDPGTLGMLATLFSNLTAKGIHLVTGEEDEKQIQKWVKRTRLIKNMRLSEKHASGYGDTVIKVYWDDIRKTVMTEVEHPSYYVPYSENEVFLLWETPYDNQGDMYVENYIIGKSGTVFDDGSVQESKTEAVGMRASYVTETQIETFLRNEKPLNKWLTGAYKKLPFSRIPLLHIPNGDLDYDEYGTSDFFVALGTIDKYHQILTDLKTQSKLLIPPIGVTGSNRPGHPDKNGQITIKYQSGMMYYLGENGSMEIPDFSPMVTALESEKKNTWWDLLRAIDLTKGATGELGEVSNLREREIKIIFGPTVSKIGNRRDDRQPYWDDLLVLIDECWAGNDSLGYKTLFPKTIKDAEFVCDAVLPTDVKEELENLTTLRQNDGIDIETISDRGIKLLGLSGDPVEIAKNIHREQDVLNFKPLDTKE